MWAERQLSLLRTGPAASFFCRCEVGVEGRSIAGEGERPLGFGGEVERFRRDWPFVGVLLVLLVPLRVRVEGVLDGESVAPDVGMEAKVKEGPR